MKNLLLFFCLLFSIIGLAQDHWTQYATAQPTASTGVRSISIVDANNTWLNMACGTTNCTPVRRYSKTVNGGLVWTSGVVDLGIDSANLQIGNIHGVSASVAYASVYPIVTGVMGGVWKTGDGGTTWIRQSSAAFSGDTSYTNLVYFWNANDGLVMGDPENGYFEIYKTNNGGALWTRLALSPELVPLYADEYCVNNRFTTNDDNIWVETTYGRILHSSNRGLTWSVSQSPIPDFGGGLIVVPPVLAFTDANNGLMQTNDFELYGTSDGGLTWAQIPCAGALRNLGIANIPGLPNTYISVGEDLLNTERGSSYSIDGGLNWTNINDNPDVDFVQGNVVSFFDQNTGFAGGFNTSAIVGGIYKWNVQMCRCFATTAFSNDKSVTVSPNPTSGLLSITSNGISQIIVLDIFGKQISSANYINLNIVNLDFGSFSNGIYMVKVANYMGTSTIKVVKD